ncbi:hypothetical protein ACHAXN_006467 [Cyclotella atomus]|jgi:hypothetical protein
MSSLWDNVLNSASEAVTKAAAAAGSATQTAASRAKLHADLLVIDRDILTRKEKFGVDMYTHLEQITSTQEFYVAEDKLINILRPTLIKAQREVAAYEKKRDAMKGKVNLAEANRSATGSILTAETMGQKLFNAASFLSAGAKEAACKTELAMLERQIRGFKEEFGVELYPVFQSMEDNEGWLPTDRKVRSLYDACREDIGEMEKSKAEKREQIRQLEGVEGSGLTPPSVPVVQQAAPTPAPVVVATPVPSNYQMNGQSQWAPAATASESSNAHAPYGTSYGSSQPTASYGSSQQQVASNFGATAPYPIDNTFGSTDNKTLQNQTGFDFMQTQSAQNSMSSLHQSTNTMSVQQPTISQFGNNNMNPSSVFDPFDGLSTTAPSSFGQNNTTGFVGTPAPAATSFGSTAPAVNKNAFDPFANNSTLSDADVNLFKY